MAKARPIPELSKDDPFAAAAARVVAVRTWELVDAAEGVLDTTDIERVHDMRVATRRLRAALEVFEPCFPKRRFREALKEVKALADALGGRRDRDVHIVALGEFEAEVGAADRPGIRSLIRRMGEEQVEANLALAPYVSEERVAALAARLDELAAEAHRLVTPEPESEPKPEPVAEPEPEAAPEPPPAQAPVAQPAAAPAVTNGGEPR